METRQNLQILFNFDEYTLEKYDCQTSPYDILVGSSGENVNVKENSSELYGMPLQYSSKGGIFGTFSAILGDCPWLPWQPLLVPLINHIQNIAVIYMHIYAAKNQ